MNLVKAAELLKSAPENTLKQYLANPNGEFPEYLVASEIERRNDMRKRYAAELSGKPPKTSIIQELLQRDTAALRAPEQGSMEAPPEAMGLGAVPPPEGMQLSQAPIMDAVQQPQQFAGGGAVAFAEGGGIADMFNEYMRPSAQFAGGGAVEHFAAGNSVSYKPDLSAFDVNTSDLFPEEKPQVGDIASFQKQFSGMLGPSATEGYQDVLSKQREELAGRKKNYLSDFLIRSGLGMATSKSVHPLQAAAQGLAGGFEDYQKAKEADAAAERSLTDAEFKFKAAKRAEDMGLLGLSRQAFDAAKADQRAYYEGKRAAASLHLTSAKAKDDAIRGAADLGLRAEDIAMRGRDIAAANQRHKETMAMEERRIQAQIERDKAVTPDVQIRAASAAQNARDSWMKTFISDPTLAPSWYTDLTTNINTLTGLNRQRAIQELQRKIDEESGAARILNIAGINTGAPV